MKLAWITDPHLDHLDKKDPGALKRLGEVLDHEGVSTVLIGGDISDARNFEAGLRRLAEVCRRPLYFVLGNHDYYFGSVADVRGRAAALNHPGVQWLPGEGVVELDRDTALIGHGGWGDAHRGDLKDFFILTDYIIIKDLADTIGHNDFWINGLYERSDLVTKLQQLGKEAAEYLELQLHQAMEKYRRIVILTHVTPFVETCTYKDKPGSDQGFPCFLWDFMGNIINNTAAEHPEIEFLVLSGHTHQNSQAQIGRNIRAWSGLAEYGELHYRLVQPDASGSWSVEPSIIV